MIGSLIAIGDEKKKKKKKKKKEKEKEKERSKKRRRWQGSSYLGVRQKLHYEVDSKIRMELHTDLVIGQIERLVTVPFTFVQVQRVSVVCATIRIQTHVSAVSKLCVCVFVCV